MNKKIYIKDWLQLKPYKKQVPSDSYYLRICNHVQISIRNNVDLNGLHEYLDDDDIDILSCFLTSYFEDLISETNIWNSFVRIHQRLYGKVLPFYNLDDYYEEEVNHQDVCFLIWYFFNIIQDKWHVGPFNEFIVEMGEDVIDIFNEEWEVAPENKQLKTFYQINQDESDFYVARNLIDTVLFKTYLFYPDTGIKLRKQEIEILEVSLEDGEDEDRTIMYLNDNRDIAVHTVHTKLLSLTGKDWVSEILGENHPLSKEFLAISKKIQGYFLYKGQDENHIFIEHIASSKKFNLKKISFSGFKSLKELDTVMYIGIVMWKNEWWFSGTSFQHPFEPDLVLDEKNSVKSRIAVNFLDHQSRDTYGEIEQQLLVFKEFNNGSQIAFLPSTEIHRFYEAYMAFFNKSLNLSKEEAACADKKAKEDGLLKIEDVKEDFSKISESGLVFFNPKSGLEIALAVNSAFPTPQNPYFKEEDSKEHVSRLFMNDQLSKGLAMYCIDNYKNNLSLFTDDTWGKYLDDIDFLLRYWKGSNYHTIPSISYI